MQDDASDGIGRACAVVQQLVERVIAGDSLILLEGIEEGVEEGGIEAVSADGAHQRSEAGVLVRRVGESSVEAMAKVAERKERSFASSGRAIVLIGQVIGGAAEPVDMGEGIAQMPRNQKRKHREILVVCSRERSGGDGCGVGGGGGHGV